MKPATVPHSSGLDAPGPSGEGHLSPHRLVVVAILVAAFGLRVVGAGDFPPGLYHDEAANGLDALEVAAGWLPVWLPANNGREPLYVVMTVPFVAVLGATPVAVRLAAAFVATAAVAAVYALGVGLVGARSAVVAAGLMAAVPWAVMLGRVGLRAGTLPLVMALAGAAALRGWRGGDSPGGRRWQVATGALAGATLYTYTAARLAPLLLAAAVPTLVRAGPEIRGRARRAVARALPAAAVVALPLAVAAARDPGAVLGRAGQVAVVEPGAGLLAAAAAVAGGLARAAGMFIVAGDTIPRHNIPGRPLFGPLAGVLFLVGVAALVRRWRHGSSPLLLAWLVVMSLPTALAQDAPHFLRAAGVLPAAVLAAAVGAEVVAGVAGSGRARLALALALAAVAVGAEAADIIAYARSAQVRAPGGFLYTDFEAGAVGLARDVNIARGAGWRGGWAVPPGPAANWPPSRGGGPGSLGAGQARRVWLDRRLRDGWAAVPFLVDTQALTLADPYDPVLSSPGVAYLWPYQLDLPRLWADLPPGAAIEITPGTLERGDLEAEPRLLYLRAQIPPGLGTTPPGPSSAGAGEESSVREGPSSAGLSSPGPSGAGPSRAPIPRGRFANGLELLAASARPSPRGLEVVTTWTATATPPRPLTLFVQLVAGGRLVTGIDAPLGAGVQPAAGYRGPILPVELWPRGLRLVERRFLEAAALEAGQEVIVGLYVDPARRIRVTLPDGATADHVGVPWVVGAP